MYFKPSVVMCWFQWKLLASSQVHIWPAWSLWTAEISQLSSLQGLTSEAVQAAVRVTVLKNVRLSEVSQYMYEGYIHTKDGEITGTSKQMDKKIHWANQAHSCLDYLKSIYLLLLLYSGGWAEIHLNETKERVVYSSDFIFSSLLRWEVTRDIV